MRRFRIIFIPTGMAMIHKTNTRKKELILEELCMSYWLQNNHCKNYPSCDECPWTRSSSSSSYYAKKDLSLYLVEPIK